MKHTVTLLATLLPATLAGLTAAEKSRPNILHTHADDHRPDGLHALGNPLGVVADEKQGDPCCPCVRCVGFADQGRADFMVTQPAHFAEHIAG